MELELVGAFVEPLAVCDAVPEVDGEEPPTTALFGSKVPHFFWILFVQLSWPAALPTLASLHSLKASLHMNWIRTPC